jgi:hypothetical protein
MELSESHVIDAEHLIAQSKVLCCQLEVPATTSLIAMQIARRYGGWFAGEIFLCPHQLVDISCSDDIIQSGTRIAQYGSSSA